MIKRNRKTKGNTEEKTMNSNEAAKTLAEADQEMKGIQESLPVHISAMYKAYQEEGFSALQAFELVKVQVGCMFSQKQQDNTA